MARRARAAFLGVLDGCLTREQRALSPEPLSRYRVILGAVLLIGVLTLLYAACLPLYPSSARLSQGLVVVGLLGALSTVVVLVRRGRSPTAPAFVLCGSLTLAMVGATLSVEVPGSVAHAAHMLVPALAVYLLGPRRGFFFTAIFVLNAACAHELFHSGLGHTRPVFAHPGIWYGNIMAAMSLLLGWALSWLYSTSREDSQQHLMRALRTLRESEGQLSSLVESTDDAVLSFDARVHLVTANTPAREIFTRVTGKRLRVGESVMALCPPPLQEVLQVRCGQALRGERVRTEVDVLVLGQPRTMDVTFNPVREGERVVGVTVFARDITARKEAEARLASLHRSLLDASRQAGMAEIATGVLHHVGNSLNSVNVSSNLVVERLRDSRVRGLERAVGLLREHASHLGSFLANDVRGQQLPGYLEALTRQLAHERAALLDEMGRLDESVSRIRSVMNMQQRYARGSSVLEWVNIGTVLEEAVRSHGAALHSLGIRLRLEFDAELPVVLVDRHKLAHILDNLLCNARHALVAQGSADKLLIVNSSRVGDRLSIRVTDNGVGIAPERLSRLFNQGAMVQPDGHGFGLHLSALAAGELGGMLSCESEGLGHGASFTLELPLTRRMPEVEAPGSAVRPPASAGGLV